MRTLLDLLVPSRCAGCLRAGPALCPACAAHLGQPGRVRLGEEYDGPPVYALGRYRGPVRAAVLAYKERGRRDLATALGAALGTALAGGGAALGGPVTTGGGARWLVPAPSRAAAARRRGGDHVRRLAERAAVVLAAGGVPVAVAPALRLTSGARDSVGLDPAARVSNLDGRVRTRAAGLPAPGTGVVLVDDIATTGATAAACTAVLAGAGLRVHAVLVVASAAPLLRSSELRDRSVTVCRDPGVMRGVTA